MNEIPWAAIISGLIAASVGIVTALWARKSQHEANKLTGSNQIVMGYDTLTNQVQEERAAAVTRADNLGAKVEAMDKFMREHFAGYRAYIHTLRGQVVDLGGTPAPWPDNLEQ